MALVRALVKASQIVKRSRSSNMKDASIIEIFDRALLEASQAAEARKAEEAAKKEAYIPMTLGSGQSKGLASLALAFSRQSKGADTESVFSQAGGGLKKKGWGGLALKMASAKAEGDERRSPVRGAVRLDNLMEKEAGAKPLSVEERVAQLAKRVDDNHASTLERQQKVLTRIAELDASCRLLVQAVQHAKLGAKPNGGVRQKRPGPARAQTAAASLPARRVTAPLAAGVSAQTTSVDPSRCAPSTQAATATSGHGNAERQELREENEPSAPSRSTPWDA